MIAIVLGIVMEIFAFIVLLASELWHLPFTFSLFIHICAVYLFTRGFERRLMQIKLRRELCFFFSFIFPLAGMVGIVFNVLILKKLEERLVLPETAQTGPLRLQRPEREEIVPVEEDSFASIPMAFVRSVPYSPRRSRIIPEDETLHRIHILESDYSALQETLSKSIHDLEAQLSSEPTTVSRRQLADTLLDYISVIHTDSALRKHYLRWASSEYLGLDEGTLPANERLEVMMEIAFQKGDRKHCLELSERLRSMKNGTPAALLRAGACFFDAMDYKKVTALMREMQLTGELGKTGKELSSMWYRNG